MYINNIFINIIEMRFNVILFDSVFLCSIVIFDNVCLFNLLNKLNYLIFL